MESFHNEEKIYNLIVVAAGKGEITSSNSTKTIKLPEITINTTITEQSRGMYDRDVKLRGNIIPVDKDSEEFKTIQFTFEGTMADKLSTKLNAIYKEQQDKIVSDAVSPFVNYIASL